MVITRFPPVEKADRYGLLALGGDLEIDSLLLAYRSGIFPWPFDEETLAWFAPPRRAVLFLRDFHVSRSLERERKRSKFDFRIDQAFPEVIRRCAEAKNRGVQAGTWITQGIIESYIRLHQAGFAHSIECWLDGQLTGGLYGVSIGAMFAGESMFYRRSNASKLALWFLVEHLRQKKAEWIDCQVMTPLLRSFGAVEIQRDEFMALLLKAVKKPMLFPLVHGNTL